MNTGRIGGVDQEIADQVGSNTNAVRWPSRGHGPSAEELIEGRRHTGATGAYSEPITTPWSCRPWPILQGDPGSAITGERVKAWGTLTKVEQLPEQLRSWGTKALPCMATEWLTVSGRRVPQIRLDTPITTKKGDRIRYLFPKDEGGIVGTDAAFERDWDNVNVPMLLVEGTKQFQAAASVINPNHPIAIPFGIAGCWGWCHDFKPSADLRALPADGRDVLVAFDADVSTNWMVWEAARRLERYLKQELGARSVRFLDNPGWVATRMASMTSSAASRRLSGGSTASPSDRLVGRTQELQGHPRSQFGTSFFKGSNLQTAAASTTWPVLITWPSPATSPWPSITRAFIGTAPACGGPPDRRHPRQRLQERARAQHHQEGSGAVEDRGAADSVPAGRDGDQFQELPARRSDDAAAAASTRTT